MRILGVIPARYASSRLPGKPLVDIGGRSMLERVWRRAKACAAFEEVVIATDDVRILAHAAALGAQVHMTSPEHPSGTDRLLEVRRHVPGCSMYVNIQGDEPFIDPAHMEAAIGLLRGNGKAEVATLVRPIRDEAELNNPNAVKAAFYDKPGGRVQYFSRQAIPNKQDVLEGLNLPQSPHYKHIGLYAYTNAALEQIASLQPDAEEVKHRLEQLRWLNAGMAIHAAVVADESPSVDTLEDLERVRALLAAGKLTD